MCKRFIDVGLWKQPWYLDLNDQQKTIWNYLTLMCDSAGLWKIEPYQLKRDIGHDFDLDETINAINNDYDENFKRITVKRIVYVPGKKKLWLTGFISFQYEKGNNGVNAAIPAVKGAINRLRDEGILDYAIDNGFVRVKNYNLNSENSRGCQPLATDKDKDKDNCSYVLKEDGGVGEETNPPVMYRSPAIGGENGNDLQTLEKRTEFITEKFFQEWWGVLPGPGELKLSEEIFNEYGEEAFVFALKQAQEYKIKKISYMRAICKQRKEKAAIEKEKAEARKKQEDLNRLVAQQRKEGVKLNLIEQVYGKT